MKEFVLKILRIFALVTMLMVCGVGCMFLGKTHAPWWVPIGVVFLTAILTFPFYKRWKWLTTMENKLCNILCHILCTSILVFAAFLTANYMLADSASTKEVTVMVLEKYKEEHQNMRRVGKGRYVSAGVRYSYHLKVEFDDGETEKLNVSQKTYNKAKKGKTKTLEFQKGLFGLPIITKGL